MTWSQADVRRRNPEIAAEESCEVLVEVIVVGARRTQPSPGEVSGLAASYRVSR